MRLAFISFCSVLFSFTALAKNVQPTVVHSNKCIARTTSCRYTNSFESTTQGSPNSCTMTYGYVTQEKVTVIKPDGSVVVLPDLEEKIVQKTFERSFYLNSFMTQAEWEKRCASPCKAELDDLKTLIGLCKL